MLKKKQWLVKFCFLLPVLERTPRKHEITVEPKAEILNLEAGSALRLLCTSTLSKGESEANWYRGNNLRQPLKTRYKR